MPRDRFLDTGSLIIASGTLLLFIAALFTKGLTHDLFLEAGVFLISVKIIMMAHRNAVSTKDVNHKLDKVLAVLTTPDKAKSESRDTDAASRHQAK